MPTIAKLIVDAVRSGEVKAEWDGKAFVQPGGDALDRDIRCQIMEAIEEDALAVCGDCSKVVADFHYLAGIELNCCTSCAADHGSDDWK